MRLWENKVPTERLDRSVFGMGGCIWSGKRLVDDSYCFAGRMDTVGCFSSSGIYNREAERWRILDVKSAGHRQEEEGERVPCCWRTGSREHMMALNHLRTTITLGIYRVC